MTGTVAQQVKPMQIAQRASGPCPCCSHFPSSSLLMCLGEQQQVAPATHMGDAEGCLESCLTQLSILPAL